MSNSVLKCIYYQEIYAEIEKRDAFRILRSKF